MRAVDLCGLGLGGDWGGVLRVLGIDPGYATTGYGIIESDGQTLIPITYGTIETPADLPFPSRLNMIYMEMQRILSAYPVEAVAMEEMYFNRDGGRKSNPRTILKVAMARGVILLAIEQAGLDAHEYTASQVKQAVTGTGAADKGQVQEMVKVLLGLSVIPKPDDAADALAVAICGANSYRFEKMAMV